jgi:asparagine synthase (glutamine-hydrolysing)
LADNIHFPNLGRSTQPSLGKSNPGAIWSQYAARHTASMCGMFGAIGHDVPESDLGNVFKVLDHRGPDGTGLFVDPEAKVTFAHTRLAVIDLATGTQPLESDDGNVVLVANGEIYDFERIRTSLQAKGYRFATKSDSEVIICLYQEFGLGCFEHLRGEFAFLLYDRRKRLVIAGRDRFGIKPLYFARTPGGFVFGSEMKAIFASKLVAPRLNAAGFDPLIAHDPDAPQFPFEGIEHVAPASYLAINLETGESRQARYWSARIPAQAADPVSGNSGEAEAAAAKLVLDELEEAVRLRLRADVPVGLYLSGGIDSAFIAALMKRNLNCGLHSFSIAFEGSDRNEQEFARRAAHHVQAEHHELRVTKQMLWDNLEKALWFSELPFVSLAPVGKFLLSEEARKSVTVVLTGEGADEVFLGYRRFYRDAIRDTRHPRSARRRRSAQSRRLKLGGLSSALAHRLSLMIFHRSSRPKLSAGRANAAPARVSRRPLINEIQEARIAAMPYDILSYLGDREEMAHSLEARLPFLDHKLYDAAKSIPVDFKMRDGLEKAVLRDAAKGILPDELRLRRKSGFMLTSEAVDLFGSDRAAATRFRHLLSKDAFDRAGIFSYGAFVTATILARVPARTRRLKRLRRDSNKVIMYMMQAHMLHEQFIARPPWPTRPERMANGSCVPDPPEPSASDQI